MGKGGMDNSSEAFVFIGILCILTAAAVQQMMPSPPPTAVGIDLGTTFSCVAVFEDGDVTVINNHAKRSITASVLFAPDDGGDFTVGEDARKTAAKKAGTLVYDAKRFIGKRTIAEHERQGLPFELVPGISAVRGQSEPHLQLSIAGQPARLAPEDVGTLIVHELKKAAELYVGRPIQNAVLAVPVGFNAYQINATKHAAIAAGLDVMRTIHEPTAAAMAYGLHTNSQVHTVMVYDIGGGTLDVSLLNLNNGKAAALPLTSRAHLTRLEPLRISASLRAASPLRSRLASSHLPLTAPHGTPARACGHCMQRVRLCGSAADPRVAPHTLARPIVDPMPRREHAQGSSR